MGAEGSRTAGVVVREGLAVNFFFLVLNDCSNFEQEYLSIHRHKDSNWIVVRKEEEEEKEVKK